MKVKIGGIKEISLVDVVDNVSFVVWFSYCNFRCPWCQNYPLVMGEGYEVEVDDIVKKVGEHRRFIDFLHVTGGEPTLQEDALKELFEKSPVKNSLNTNGSRPEVIRKLKMDHVAIDFKAPKEKYREVIGGVEFDFDKYVESLDILKEKVDFIEVRTTLVPYLITKKDVFWIASFLKEFFDDYGGRLVYVLQQFYPWDTVRDERFRRAPPTPVELLEEIGRKVREDFGLEVYIRSVEKIEKL